MLELGILGSFVCFLSSDEFFKINFFLKILSGVLSKCQTDWIQIRPNFLLGLIWVQSVCKGYQQMTLVGKEFKWKYSICSGKHTPVNLY